MLRQPAANPPSRHGKHQDAKDETADQCALPPGRMQHRGRNHGNHSQAGEQQHHLLE